MVKSTRNEKTRRASSKAPATAGFIQTLEQWIRLRNPSVSVDFYTRYSHVDINIDFSW
jgi:hypothetical protein